MIRARLPVAYVCEGRRIPDDLRVARALDLVSTAVLLAEKLGAAADEDMLTRRFHGVANGRS
jgi:flagellar biosynthesis GTPase FlhF